MVDFTFAPIGYVRASRGEKRLAPRQPGADGEVASIELLARDGYEDALADLVGFDHVWVVFVFDRAEAFAPKVLPPRSSKKRGLFATRSPHRPNPIGISAVRLLRIEGRVLHVDGVDFLDGTPVLDVKPYVAYADAIPDAALGWLAEEGERVRSQQAGRPVDPIPAWRILWTARAEEAVAWLASRDVMLRSAVEGALALGPEPHAYRRIRKRGDVSELAIKEWRVDFVTRGSEIVVERLRTGYRARDLATGDAAAELLLARAFVERFGS